MGDEVEEYRGWKEIADALGVSVRQAIRLSKRTFLPLVVFTDGGRVWCRRADVATFKTLNHLPLWAHRQLRAAGRLPHQLDENGEPKRARSKKRLR